MLFFIFRLFYWLVNIDLLGSIPKDEIWNVFKGGLLFDNAAIAYTLSLFIFLSLAGRFFKRETEMSRPYKALLWVSYFIPNLLNIFVNISDAAYYPYVLNRTTSSVFSEFENENSFKLMGKLAFQFWPYALVIIGLIVLLFWAYSLVEYKRLPSRLRSRKSRVAYNLIGVVQLLVAGILSFFGIRGSFDLLDRPMTPLRATVYVEDTNHSNIVLNTTFTLIRTTSKKPLPQYSFFTEEELANIFQARYSAHPLSPEDSLFGAFKGKNIVILILESFAKEYSAYLNRDIPNYPGYMPFVDSLMAQGFTMRYGFSNGRKSVQALPSLLTSLPSMGTNFVNSFYSQNELLGLPELVDRKGYQTTFYHGASHTSMGFASFVKSIGVHSYFCKDQYGDDSQYDGMWGIFDEPFLQRVAKELSHTPEPFMAGIFTLSSHTPFTLPPEYEYLRSEGTLPIHPTVLYSDQAVEKFFKAIEDQPWFRNTLFIIMADHASLTDREEYNNPSGKFAIPICFYDPSQTLVGEVTDRTAQQADVLPTLLYLLGDSTEIISYGNNILDPNGQHAAVNNLDNIYYLFYQDATIAYDPKTDHGEVSKPIPYIQTDAIDDTWNEEKFSGRIEYLKAIVQDYNRRMVQNDLLPQR